MDNSGKKTVEMTVTESHIGFRELTWVRGLDSETAQRVAMAKVVLVPESYRDFPYPIFSPETRALIDVLRQDSRTAGSVEAAVNPDTPTPLLFLHSGEIIVLATIVVQDALFPLVLNLISSYLFERYYSMRGTPRKTNGPVLRFKMAVTKEQGDQSNTLEIQAEGEAKDVIKAVSEVWERWNGND